MGWQLWWGRRQWQQEQEGEEEEEEEEVALTPKKARNKFAEGMQASAR